MARITVDVPDADLSQIDAEAKLQKVSRSKWAAIAIDAHLHQKCIISDADLMHLKDQVMQLQRQLDAKTQECDARSQKITDTNDELEQLKTRYNQTTVEDTKRWEELKAVRSENTKLKKDLEASQAATQRLQAELHDKQAEVDRIAALREELIAVRTERDKLLDTLKAKDDDVAWLRGHISQLTQQLALPPSEEEAKKKGWWQFWK